MAPAEFILDNRLGVPDGGRAAATLLVRYLRFGGRKLAYRIINSQGFKVRFAFDNPMFYFETLRKSAEQLSPEFVLKYPGLFSVVEAIAVGWNSGSRADRSKKTDSTCSKSVSQKFSACKGAITLSWLSLEPESLLISLFIRYKALVSILQ